MIATWTALFRPSFRGSVRQTVGARAWWSRSRAIQRTLGITPVSGPAAVIETVAARRQKKFWVDLPYRR